MARIEPSEADPYLVILDVAKRFGGVQALAGVSLTVGRGSIHALVGENGAGKSTLGRIVAGEVVRDSGRILLEGEPVSFRSPREALERRIAAIAQEPSVIPQLTVAENVLLGLEPRSAGFLRRRGLGERYRALADSAGFDLPGATSAGRLRTAEQQKVEILRALSREARLIVMDEPSAALSSTRPGSCTRSFARWRAGARRFSSSRTSCGEVLELADTVSVLRDGNLVRTSASSAETRGHADRGDARQAADLDLPRQAVSAAGLGRRALGARPLGARRHGRDASSCAPARSSASPGSSAPGARSSRGRSTAPARHPLAATAARHGRAARPRPEAEPRRGSRDDPGVAQG